MLVDSDVLIWNFRGYAQATRRLDQLPHLTISAITYLELLQGMRSRAELTTVQKSLALRNTERLPVTADHRTRDCADGTPVPVARFGDGGRADRGHRT